MKIAVTGANGLIGQHLVRLLLRKGYHVIGIGRGPNRLSVAGSELFNYYAADITDDSRIFNIFKKEQPQIVVHGAAMTQVDDCELHQQKCEEINVKGTAQLLLIAEEFCQQFIYISTDFVFDGQRGNYKEGDNMNPLSWYGFTKVQAENIVEISDIPWAIVRTCLVYGNGITETRRNIVSWVKQSLEEGKKIQVVSDQWRTPTFVEDVAMGILLIIQKKATGIFHISGKDVLTPYEMAIITANKLHLNKGFIEKADGSTFTQAARRPPKTGLDITKAKIVLGFSPLGFEESIEKMFPGN